MAQRAIREHDGKRIIFQNWKNYIGNEINYTFSDVLVTHGDQLLLKSSDVNTQLQEGEGLVVKPDMLFGKRGLNKLVYYKNELAGDVSVIDAAQWIDLKREKKETLMSGESGFLTHFLVSPYLRHELNEEYYVSFTTQDEADVIFLSTSGGVNIEENWEKVVSFNVPLEASREDILQLLSVNLPADVQHESTLANFVTGLFLMFRELHFSYLEVNPFVLRENEVFILDLVAKLDDTAGYLMTEYWGNLIFPTAFGVKELSKEEREIRELDQKSGASLKLTILNPEGRIWTLVAGGGASVVYSDTIMKYADPSELANYGEYSGNPSSEETFYYARTIIDLMTRGERHPEGKVLIVGGAIANFTDVAKTFDGIIRAMEELANDMIESGVRVYVRRGGPNYRDGLKKMKTAGERLKVPIEVYSPETHLTDIVRIALAN